MCKTTDIDTKRILIVGAGPAGLLAAILFLRRNLLTSSTKYQVTLIDPGTDYGKLDEEGLARARSWMIGLSCHGLSSIREVPGLYEDYIRGLGVDTVKAVIGITKKIKFTLKASDFIPEDSAFTVDRNYICAALSRYLNDNFEKDGNFISHYNTKALYVDGDNKCVIARPKNESNVNITDMNLDYDILLGCDGIRSIVRNAFLSTHRDFEFDLRGSFGYGKSVHVALPEDVEDGTFMIINECLPGWVSFVLPESGQKLNVALGTRLDKKCCVELKSSDPKVVADYFREHWHAFDIDCDEVGEQWVQQGWNTVGQVHCNFYHSEPLRALLLGDAAHATCPNIGQGMNTALADASALNSLLNDHKDDWDVVLPKFSELRVKEGNALTDLSFHTYSLSPGQQITLMVRQNVRIALNKLLPWIVDRDPMYEIPRGMKLSEAYHRMSKLGVIQRVRRNNDDMMRSHFEKSVGMVRDDESAGIMNKMFRYVMVPVFVACAVAVLFGDKISQQ
mmetsp:Transcript_19117/g.28057  ORF Transcript_19117/g.28057 Transcript_19117/m.28057 type:complete len:506 (-) Transcript_19117:450-1967(-)